MPKLTPKQQIFVDEYLVDLNGKQAAIRAGYSPKTAEVQASQLLSKLKVRAHIETALAERSKRTGINADRVLRELGKLAFYNAPDLINMDTASLKKKVSKDDTAAIASVKVKKIPTSEGMGVEREIKLTDKIKALELIGKHLGMFSDKLEIKGSVPVTIVDDIE